MYELTSFDKIVLLIVRLVLALRYRLTNLRVWLKHGGQLIYSWLALGTYNNIFGFADFIYQRQTLILLQTKTYLEIPMR